MDIPWPTLAFLTTVVVWIALILVIMNDFSVNRMYHNFDSLKVFLRSYGYELYDIVHPGRHHNQVEFSLISGASKGLSPHTMWRSLCKAHALADLNNEAAAEEFRKLHRRCLRALT